MVGLYLLMAEECSGCNWYIPYHHDPCCLLCRSGLVQQPGRLFAECPQGTHCLSQPWALLIKQGKLQSGDIATSGHREANNSRLRHCATASPGVPYTLQELVISRFLPKGGQQDLANSRNIHNHNRWRTKLNSQKDSKVGATLGGEQLEPKIGAEYCVYICFTFTHTT